MSVATASLAPRRTPFPRGVVRRARRTAAVRSLVTLRTILLAPSATRAGWLPTGYLAEGRAFHTATRLADGTVLVAGGYGENSRPLASAEIYDPATSRWRSTGAMTTARGHHAAALLADGRVLVAGGTTRGISDVNNVTASAEVYLPATGTWRTVGPLRTSRAYHTATTLGDGTVLVAGGYHGPHDQVASAERFDPASLQWAAAGDLQMARAGHSATLLADGRVLVAGGEGGGVYFLLTFGSDEAYDPAAGTWRGHGDSVDVGFTGHAATRLADGRVLVSGGETGLDDPAGPIPWTALDTAGWGLNPRPGLWLVYTPSMGNPRWMHTSALLADGTVLAIGGMFGCNADGTGCSGLTAVDQYLPAPPGSGDERGTWVSAPHLLERRAAHTATNLPDGTILVAGGIDFLDGGALDSAELFNPALPDLSGCALPLAMAITAGAGVGLARRLAGPRARG
jgi:hypothetical protein